MKKTTANDSETFVLDGAYLRAEASEALKSFISPLSGVFEAAKGNTSTVAEPRRFSEKKKRA